MSLILEKAIPASDAHGPPLAISVGDLSHASFQEGASYDRFSCWLGPLPASPVPGELELLYSRPIERTEADWHELVDAYVSNIDYNIGGLIRYRPGYLSVWAEPLRQILLGEGFGEKVSSAAVSLLCAWAGGDDLNNARNKELVLLLETMQESSTPLNDLYQLVVRHADGGLIYKFYNLISLALQIQKEGYSL